MGEAIVSIHFPHPLWLNLLKQPDHDRAAGAAKAMQIIFLSLQQLLPLGRSAFLKCFYKVFYSKVVTETSTQERQICRLSQVRAWRHMVPSGDSTERAVNGLEMGLWLAYVNWESWNFRYIIIFRYFRRGPYEPLQCSVFYRIRGITCNAVYLLMA